MVATPLGNPGDFSPRAREAVSAADMVLAEDTRRTGLLLAQCGLKAARLSSLHEHNEDGRIPALLEELAQGRNLALVSDAGTPLLSDPGYRLVRACREAGVRVRPFPGPSAPLTALCASGLPPQPFVFLGFPPRKAGGQKQFFAPYAGLEATIIFFERKDRLRQTLELLHGLYGPREACIARELTKTYEEFIFLTLDKLELLPEELLGELTVLVGPPKAGMRMDETEVLRLARALQEKSDGSLKPRELARQVKDAAQGWNTDEIYSLLGK